MRHAELQTLLGGNAKSYRQSLDKLVAMVKAGQQDEALAYLLVYLRTESRKVFWSRADAIASSAARFRLKTG